MVYGIEEHTPVLIREKTEGKQLTYQMKIVQIKELADKEAEFFSGFDWSIGKVKLIDPKYYPKDVTSFKNNVLGYSNDQPLSIKPGILTVIESESFVYKPGFASDFWLDPNYANQLNGANTMYDPYNDYPMNFHSTMYNAFIMKICKEPTKDKKFYTVDIPVIANGVLVKFFN